MILTFEELRNLKDRLPHGSMERIASELGIAIQEVRNYFGATDFSHGGFIGAHYETGVHGGYVMLDDDKIYQKAVQLADEVEHQHS
jgi:predicted transcriptional regulator